MCSAAVRCPGRPGERPTAAGNAAPRPRPGLAERQVEWRSPGLAGAVVRDGEPVWDGAAGTSDATDPGALPTADTQFRMGSITKTFTAVLVMQCRDDGLLDLDDPVDQHLTGTRHGDLTIRRLLAHLSGLQREPHGDVWDSLSGPTIDDLLAGLDEAERVLPPGRRLPLLATWPVALLGQVVGAAARRHLGRGAAASASSTRSG